MFDIDLLLFTNGSHSFSSHLEICERFLSTSINPKGWADMMMPVPLVQQHTGWLMTEQYGSVFPPA